MSQVGITLFFCSACFTIMYVCIYLNFFFLLRVAPAAHGGSQARGPIGAIAAGLCHSHSNTGSELHLRLTSELMATPDP